MTRGVARREGVMQLGDYRLLSQSGAGRDGIAYRAADPDGRDAEVLVLAAARADPERWPLLSRRLRTAALLDHPGAVRVREVRLDHEPPFVALDPTDGVPAEEALRGRIPLAAAEALALARELAAVLVAAHRLGMTHGRLTAEGVRLTAGREVKLDFTGADVGTAPPARSADPAADVAALGELLAWCLTGERPSPGRAQKLTLPGEIGIPLSRLINGLTAPEPADRPSVREVVERLRGIGRVLEATAVQQAPPTALDAPDVAASLSQTRAAPAEGPVPEEGDELAGRERLGRYRLVRRLGRGGMGAVYQGEDPADGRAVAIKVLRSQLVRHPDALRRFHKEARLLAEVNSPYVANLLEVNEDDGVHYLVLEFVAGRDLGDLLAERRRLDERMALSVVADVCRGLAEAHARGVVHRDIKPENILIQETATKNTKSHENKVENDPERASESGEDSFRGFSCFSWPFLVKLSDFGLARHIDESQSLHLTQAGAILGTPLYMAPEQARGQSLDARADVYSLGATLFHLLAGRPPFIADSPLAVIALHAQQQPPPLRSLSPDVSDAACGVVEKCLAKSPDARYPDAAALLLDLERLLRGEATAAEAHPKLPDADPRKLVRYDWSWDLEASPEQLWPLVCNTERFNRAAGLPPVRWTTRAEPDGRVRRFGEFRKAGLVASWEEFPFEWIEGRRFGVLREYEQGPFKWFVAVVELEPRPGGGTRLTSHVRIEPHGLLGRTVAAVEVGVNGKRAMDRVYRRFDAALTGQLGDAALVDAFEEPSPLTAAQARRLETLLDRLAEAAVEPAVVERLGDFLGTAPPQEVARIRPLALARRLALDPEQFLAACLHGAKLGLLELLWDLLCPLCRIPSEVKDGLRALRRHGRCEVCRLDFELDFANSVEMIFRAHPEVREADLNVYCIGGPAHSPHVAAQVRVAGGEALDLELALPEGSYRLRGPQLPFSADFRVQGGTSGAVRWDVPLPRGPRADLPRVLRAGRQTLALVNDHDRELVVRVERTAPRADALTAARASSLALFRELFPGEVLSPGQLVSVATVTLLVAGLADGDRLYRDMGDARAFGVLHEYYRRTAEWVRQEGGAVVKTVGESVVASFAEPLPAVRAALSIAEDDVKVSDAETTRPRVGVHRGAALAATLNDHLDYFGATANAALRLPELAAAGEVLLTADVAADPEVAALLRARGLTAEVIPAELPGLALGLAHRLRRR